MESLAMRRGSLRCRPYGACEGIVPFRETTAGAGTDGGTAGLFRQLGPIFSGRASIGQPWRVVTRRGRSARTGRQACPRPLRQFGARPVMRWRHGREIGCWRFRVQKRKKVGGGRKSPERRGFGGRSFCGIGLQEALQEGQEIGCRRNPSATERPRCRDRIGPARFPAAPT